MTPADLFMLWVTNEITFEGYIFCMDSLYPVAGTPALHVYAPLPEVAPTLFALRAADAANDRQLLAA